jgi:hypothetical protein
MKNLKAYEIINHAPDNANIISPKFIFTCKKYGEGNLIKRKAHLVARCFTQQFGMDYTNTFSPTLKHNTLKVITAIRVKNQFKIKQLDIIAGYLNATLSDESLYMYTPGGHPSFNRHI